MMLQRQTIHLVMFARPDLAFTHYQLNVELEFDVFEALIIAYLAHQWT